MRISLKLANGATLEFEGDAAEFERLSEFLAAPPESLAAEAPFGGSIAPPAGSGDGSSLPPPSALDPASVAAQFEKLAPNNDQERVTIIAHMAVESGKEGIGYDALIELYRELGLPTPAQFPAKTFSNAKTSGLVALVKPGVWRPTFRGSNFARGFGRGERQTRRSGSRSQASANREGGETD